MNSHADTRKRFYIHTLGCKVNQYESQAVREILLKAGFKECLSKEIADIYIINTCTVTHHADRQSRYLAGMFHRANPSARIVVTGCYVEKNAEEISFLPGVAHIVKNEDKARIAEILSGQGDAPDGGRQTRPELMITDFKGRSRAFVKIQDGCENRCSYCKVPLVRPVLRSKQAEAIAEEVNALAEHGFREIVLAGICLGAWGRDISQSASLVDALKAVDAVSGDFRIRISSIEPKYVTDELIEFMSGSRRVCPHLHIPLQSGDDEVLALMNRQYKAAEYRAMVDKLRRSIKDIAVSTDVMVGFPGERDANFANTLNFIKSIVPSRTHIFTYSRRDGTAACDLAGAANEPAIKKRYYDLKAAAMMSSYIYQEMFVGKRLDILVESKRDRRSGLLTGYSGNYIKVLFDGPDTIKGRIAAVKIDNLIMGRAVGSLFTD